MQVLESAANVDFRECPGNSCEGNLGFNFVTVRDSTNDTTAGSGNACVGASANNSPVGRQGGVQIINIVSWTGAASQFIIVHELMHTLGIFHEQSRPDRDTYVDVASLCANVTGGCASATYLGNFPIDNNATAYGYYDFDSVMQYGQCSFSRNTNCPATSTAFPDGGVTIRVKAPFNTQTSPDGVQWPAAIGQRRRLSALDRLTVSFLYARAQLAVRGRNIHRPARRFGRLFRAALPVAGDRHQRDACRRRFVDTTGDVFRQPVDQSHHVAGAARQCHYPRASGNGWRHAGLDLGRKLPR